VSNISKTASHVMGLQTFPWPVLFPGLKPRPASPGIPPSSQREHAKMCSMAFLCGDLRSPLLSAPFSQGGTLPSCLPWMKESGWRHHLPALAPELFSASAWLSHFNRTGTSGSGWIDQILFKGLLLFLHRT